MFRLPRTKHSFLMQMTLWVVGSVTVVVCLILLVSAFLMGKDYDKQLRKTLADNANVTVNAINQRMSRVWCATNTAALLAEKDAQRLENLDSVLVRAIKGIECVDGVSIIFRKGFFPSQPRSGNYMHFAYLKGDDINNIILSHRMIDYAENDSNWAYSFEKGEKYMSSVFHEEVTSKGNSLVSYSVPLTDDHGQRYGIFCTSIRLKWIIDIVNKNKSRDDIFVSVYGSDGKVIVEPPSEIKTMIENQSNDVLLEECVLPQLNWVVKVSAHRDVIDDSVRKLVLAIALILLATLISASIILAFVVRYIGKPFAHEQRLTAEANAVMQHELEIAAGTQRELVPHSFPPFPERKDIDMYACLHPAREVGGDLYDYFIHNDHLYFCIGDVSGKGLQASMLMSATRYLFRSMAASMPMAEAMTQINNSLCTDNTRCMFVTFFFGQLDLKTGRLDYCNAGHNAPVLTNNGRAEFISVTNTMPLGLWEDVEYVIESIQLSHQDILLLYTDGITEAMNADNEAFGNDRTLECISLYATPENMVKGLYQRVMSHADGAPQSDDITLLSIKFNQAENKEK